MIAAIVFGRAENRPFPGRNTFPLLGRPLMVYPLLAAAHSVHVEHVFLSTDDAGMIAVGRHYGADVLERPAELRDASVSLERIIEHAHMQVACQVKGVLEALVVLLANAPTVTSSLIDQGIDLLRADQGLDAVMSVSLHNEFRPEYALQLTQERLVRPVINMSEIGAQDVYFPDALLWVMRPPSIVQRSTDHRRANWIVDTMTQRVAPLVHEGYGDVDYPWQIPIVEEWLRRSGFTETATPYAPMLAATPSGIPSAIRQATVSEVARRVLITTVPFAQFDKKPMEMLEEAGAQCIINPLGRRLKEEELAALAQDVTILIAGTEPITEKVMAAARHLRLISRVGIGLDNVDLREARARGIPVSYTPDAPSPAVAELTICLMLALLRNVAVADRNMRNGIWHRLMGRRLSDLTVGVVGVGRIGQRVIAHLAGGFPTARILANDLQPDVEFGRRYKVQWVDKEILYREADLITLHVPLTFHTRRLISQREIDLMRPTTMLINTSRGNMIDERDLASALKEGRLAGAAIDVFGHEPYSGELATLDRCILTCHMGSMSQDCRQRMELEAAQEAVRFLNGQPLEHLVPESEYLLAGVYP